MAEIDGDNTNNSLTGTGGNDTINGFDGNDSINGGSGNDTLFGGDGDDTITGGGGDDLIIGGRGDDTMSAGSGSPTDTFVIRDGDGNDTITDFDPSEPDIIDFRMDEMSSFADVSARMTQDGSDTVITYDNGDTIRLLNVTSGDLSATNFTFNTGPVCLHAGTFIATPYGAVRIEHLCLGDLVNTRDHGPRPIRHVLHQIVHFSATSDDGKPVMIAPNAIRDGVPNRTTIVSPQHRILLTDHNTCDEVFVAAIKLSHHRGVRQMRGRDRADYFNLLFDYHEVILANGMPTESLLLTPHVVRAAPKMVGANRNQSGVMRPARKIIACEPDVARHARHRVLTPLGVSAV